MKLHRILIALAAVLLLAQLSPARELFDLWPDAPEKREPVLDACADAYARSQALELMLGPGDTMPCARLPKRAMPFLASAQIVNPYAGRAPLTHIGLETCVRWQEGQGYENRTPLVPLACSFFGHGIRVRISLDPAGESVLQDVTLTMPARTYVEPGFDGLVDFGGMSGVYEAQRGAQRVQNVVPVAPDEEDFYRAPFNIYASVVMLNGTIAGAGAFTAKVDGDGFVILLEDANLDGVIEPGGEPVANGASVAVVFHWNEGASLTAW